MTNNQDGLAGRLQGLEKALRELLEAADAMVISLPAHWHDDATVNLTDAADDAREVLTPVGSSPTDFVDIARPPQAPPPPRREFDDSAPLGSNGSGVKGAAVETAAVTGEDAAKLIREKARVKEPPYGADMWDMGFHAGLCSAASEINAVHRTPSPDPDTPVPTPVEVALAQAERAAAVQTEFYKAAARKVYEPSPAASGGETETRGGDAWLDIAERAFTAALCEPGGMTTRGKLRRVMEATSAADAFSFEMGEMSEREAYLDGRRGYWQEEAAKQHARAEIAEAALRAPPAGTGAMREEIAWAIISNLRTDVPAAKVRELLDREAESVFRGGSWHQGLENARRQADAVLALLSDPQTGTADPTRGGNFPQEPCDCLMGDCKRSRMSCLADERAARFTAQGSGGERS